ncbi:MAG: hypothetical protein LBL69_00010 [Zoogloeaceae bacterium]|jgi:uncharacterized protein (DUF1778 family)|nr:hypothetical protein [Zoogloeaceae bacterium]
MSEARTAAYPLRMPASLKRGIARAAKREGTSVNSFITLAAAEKLAALETADFFAERAKRANPALFLELLNRPGGELPRAGDEIIN